MPVTPEFLQQTKSVWQKFTPEALSLEDCRQATENAARFFGMLTQWQAAVEKKDDRLSQDKSKVAAKSFILCILMGTVRETCGTELYCA